MERERSIIDELMEYLVGYENAIFLVIDDLRTDINLMFPIMLLIAQYMEIWIKTIALCYSGQEDNFDIKCLKLDNHNIEELILCKDQISEFKSNGIMKDEIDEIIELYKYFSNYCDECTLTEMARFPIKIRNNKSTLKIEISEMFSTLNIEEFVEKAKEICNKSKCIMAKFLEEEYKKRIDYLKILDNIIHQV